MWLYSIIHQQILYLVTLCAYVFLTSRRYVWNEGKMFKKLWLKYSDLSIFVSISVLILCNLNV